MAMINITVRTDEVLDELSDAELLAECKERGLSTEAPYAGRMDDLQRALSRRDWAEVEYLLLTYVLPRDVAHTTVPLVVRPSLGRPAA